MTIHARVEPSLKKNAEMIFAAIGLTTSQAISLFLKQVELHKGLPLDLKIPNAETIAAMRELEADKKLPVYDADEYSLRLKTLQKQHGSKNKRK